MTTDLIAEIAKSGTRAELARQIADLREALATVQETLTAATGAGALTATIDSIDPDGSATRVTLTLPQTFGDVWTEFRVGDAVSLIDTPNLPTAIGNALAIDL